MASHWASFPFARTQDTLSKPAPSLRVEGGLAFAKKDEQLSYRFVGSPTWRGIPLSSKRRTPLLDLCSGNAQIVFTPRRFFDRQKFQRMRRVTDVSLFFARLRRSHLDARPLTKRERLFYSRTIGTGRKLKWQIQYSCKRTATSRPSP
jgi:hypothetical protein